MQSFTWYLCIFLKTWSIFIFFLAEVPEAAWVNLQLAEDLLLCKQFSKICPSAFSVLDPPVPGGERAGSKLHKNLPCTGGDMFVNFITIGAGVWVSISPRGARNIRFHSFIQALHIPTGRQTNKHLNSHLYINVFIYLSHRFFDLPFWLLKFHNISNIMRLIVAVAMW